MKKQVFALALCSFLFASYTTPSFAVSLSVDSFPSSIDQSEEAEVGVTLLCSGCKDSYLRGVFYPTGTSYFGYTQDNAGAWSNAPASGCTTFFKVEQADFTEGSWSGTLKIKPDKDSSYYKGPSEYFFKVGKYTSSCGSAAWSEDVIIAISGPTPTSAPTNTPKPTKTPTPVKSTTSSKTSSPTKAIISVNNSSNNVSPKVSPKPSVSAKIAQNKTGSEFARLNTSSQKETSTDKVAVLGTEKSSVSYFTILGGIVFIVIAAVMLLVKYSKKLSFYEKIQNLRK